MKKSAISIALATIIVFGSSCASVVSKSSYPIKITSSPSESNILIKNRSGMEIYSGKTPSSLILDASCGFFKRELYQVKFEKEGYDTKTMSIYFKVDGWYFGNILFGGLIGFLIIDPATGAMYKIATPYISGTLSKSSTSIDKKELKIYDMNNIPKEWKENLVLIEQ